VFIVVFLKNDEKNIHLNFLAYFTPIPMGSLKKLQPIWFSRLSSYSQTINIYMSEELYYIEDNDKNNDNSHNTKLVG